LAKAYEQNDVIEEEENEGDSEPAALEASPFNKRSSTANLIHQPTFYNLASAAAANPLRPIGPASPHESNDPTKKIERFNTQHHGPTPQPKITPKQKLRAAGHVLMGIQKQKPGLQLPETRLGIV